jgi:hypothetical protein
MFFPERRVIMKSTHQANGVGMMTLALSNPAGAAHLLQLAMTLRAVPRILRVRVDIERAQMELMFQQPAPGLLSQVHQALQEQQAAKPVAGA